MRMTETKDSSKAKVDLEELKEELDKAIEDDKRYWLENDAKFRAVNQGTATYDEFRDIVKAAHLRPLEGRDLKDLSRSQRGCVWNLVSSDNRTKTMTDNDKDNATSKKQGAATESTENFIRKFKACSTPHERFALIEEISHSELPNVIKTDLPIEIMSILIEALLAFPGTTQCIVTVYRFLKQLTQIQRFNLGLEFLSHSEKDLCKELFDKLLDSSQDFQQDLAEFGITEREINILRKQFKV